MSSTDDAVTSQISDDRTPQTSQVLVNLLLNRLALLLLDGVGGDMDLARIGASHIVGAYQGTNTVDLVTVVRMASFALTAIQTVSAAVTEDLPLAGAISGYSAGPSRSLLALAGDLMRRPHAEDTHDSTVWTHRCALFARGCVAEALALTCRATHTVSMRTRMLSSAAWGLLDRSL